MDGRGECDLSNPGGPTEDEGSAVPSQGRRNRKCVAAYRPRKPRICPKPVAWPARSAEPVSASPEPVSAAPEPVPISAEPDSMLPTPELTSPDPESRSP